MSVEYRRDRLDDVVSLLEALVVLTWGFVMAPGNEKLLADNALLVAAVPE